MERELRHLAASSAHLHLAAAAHYFAEAGDVEMGQGALGRHGGGGDELGNGDVHGGDKLGHGDVHGGDKLGHGDVHGGCDADSSDDEDLYDLMLLLASFVPPAPAYKALPRDVVEGLAWTWCVLVYGVFLAVAVTAFSVRVLGLGTSTRCLPTTLRVLLLTATIVSEVSAAIYMMPATTLTVVGACFTVVLLLAAHLVASRRRRRHH